MPWYNKTNSYCNSNTDWKDHNSILYVELAPGVTAEQATARIKNIATAYFEAWKEDMMIDPMDHAYLHDQIDSSTGKESGGHITYVWLFSIIGIFTLILACINFMNLATARSETRAREVGIRKTIGSHRWQLIGQFFSESILVTLIAFVLALLLAAVSLPFFNNIADKQMTIPWTNAWFWSMAISFVLLTGLLAGSYPAFYLSGFRPVQGVEVPRRDRPLGQSAPARPCRAAIYRLADANHLHLDCLSPDHLYEGPPRRLLPRGPDHGGYQYARPR